MLSLVRNTFIRVAAFFEQILRGLIAGWKNLFSFLGNLFGFNKSTYYVEESTRSTSSSQLPMTKTTAEPAKPTSVVRPVVPKSIANSGSNRRSSGSETDYFRNMARQIKKG